MPDLMDLEQRKQQFSFAYIRAVATVAGYGVSEPAVDDDSVDLTISSKTSQGIIRSPRLDLQAKCSERDVFKDDGLHFPLKMKNYDDLRPENVLVPRVLVVVMVPDKVEDWLVQTPEQLSLRKCGYWVSLRGQPPTDNAETKTVLLPTANVFTVAALAQIMGRIGDGACP